MAKYFVDEQDLSDVADAIREKLSSSASLMFPDGFVDGIEDIETGITPTGMINITQNGTTDVTNYASANIAVQNSYSNSDEGKVVSNGALVAQGSDTVTENDTYDTTLINSLTVNVSGGGGSTQKTGTVTPVSRTQTITFDPGLSELHGIIIVPNSTTPVLSGGRTTYALIAIYPGTSMVKSILLYTNNAGSSLNVINVSASDYRFTLNGTEVTASGQGQSSYFEAIEYAWIAW